MSVTLITTQSEFDAYCDEIRHAPLIAFDTEFVSERYFRPKLSLMQFATATSSAVVDPLAVPDLSAWWRIMSDSTSTILVHGGREEIRFCLRNAGAPPKNLVDVQIAEGLLTRTFPSAYKNLVQRVLGRVVHCTETRTDWEYRPLSQAQVEYALEDVTYLPLVWEKQRAQLAKLGRAEWATVEFRRFVEEVVAETDREGWRRLPQANRFSARELAVARELWTWRENYAQIIDRPARVAFRDDLMTEIVRRRPKTVRDLNSTRGLQRRDYQRVADDIVEAVRRGMETPEDDLPPRQNFNKSTQHDDVLTKLTSIVLADRCAQLGIAMSLVGTTADVQEFVHWHVTERRRPPAPELMQGWRATVCGELLHDILDGRIRFRVQSPKSANPLRYERVDGA
ncbi:MAG: HRDC domain-containing protein [Planctomyces sp.]|nr:HRDC domain-containing protein [Planctomyces sp.]